MNEILTSVARLKKDERAAAERLTQGEARYFVDEYYARQEDRIRAAGRVRAMTESGEPCECVGWLEKQSDVLETQIKGMLDRYSMSQPIGQWMRSIRGIGPVIAAGFMANLDINRIHKETGQLECTSAGHFWSICGLAPGNDRRIKGQKLNYNPALKRLCYLTGESFKRLGKDDEDGYYRHVYDRRKAYESAKNEALDYADQATAAITEKKFGADTIALTWYKQGKLPPARIDRRAARYAVKIFLSNLHEVWWKMEHPELPYPKPYALAHKGHIDYIPPPNLHLLAA